MPNFMANLFHLRWQVSPHYAFLGCVYRDVFCNMQPWVEAVPYSSALIISALYPFGAAESSTSFGWHKGRNEECHLCLM